MIEFVIYDDQKEFCSMILDAVRKATGDLFEQCIVKIFNKYDKNFEKVIKEDKASKIYIMDIEVPNSKSGIDVARYIRKKDWDSIIILVTSHVELSYEALKAQIMLLDFICKQSDCFNSLIKTLKKAIHKVNDRKVLNFEICGNSYRVYTDDILYIQKDSIDRKSIIKTTYNTVPVNVSLTNLLEKLDDRFYQTHRSCINFENGINIDYLSRDKKKGLKERV